MGGGPGAGASGGRLPPRSRTGGRQSGVRRFGASGVFLRSSRSPQVTNSTPRGELPSGAEGLFGPGAASSATPPGIGSGAGAVGAARPLPRRGLGPGPRRPGGAGPLWRPGSCGAAAAEPSEPQPRAVAALPLGKVSPGPSTLFERLRCARPARAGPLGCLGRGEETARRAPHGGSRGSDGGLWFPWSQAPAPEVSPSSRPGCRLARTSTRRTPGASERESVCARSLRPVGGEGAPRRRTWGADRANLRTFLRLRVLLAPGTSPRVSASSPDWR